MSRRRPSKLAPDSNLVVVYFGTDPHYHRPDPTQPNKPICSPIRPPGVLTSRNNASRSELIACNQCWPDQPYETRTESL